MNKTTGVMISIMIGIVFGIWILGSGQTPSPLSGPQETRGPVFTSILAPTDPKSPPLEAVSSPFFIYSDDVNAPMRSKQGLGFDDKVGVRDKVADAHPDLLLILDHLRDFNDDREAALVAAGGSPTCEGRRWRVLVQRAKLDTNGNYDIATRFQCGFGSCSDVIGRERWTIENNQLVLVSRETKPWKCGWAPHEGKFDMSPEYRAYGEELYNEEQAWDVIDGYTSEDESQ
jgi:hypothetical protein